MWRSRARLTSRLHITPEDVDPLHAGDVLAAGVAVEGLGQRPGERVADDGDVGRLPAVDGLQHLLGVEVQARAG